MNYATTTQVATFMGIDAGDLPTDIDKLIRDASFLMDYVTLNYIQDYYIESSSFTDTNIEEYVKNATCAQIEYWIELGDASSDIIGNTPASFTVGNFSVDYGKGTPEGLSQGAESLSTRARRYLLLAGLLYRGVRR